MSINILETAALEKMVVPWLESFKEEVIETTIKDAQKKVEQEIRRRSAGIAINLTEVLDYKKMGRDLTITIKGLYKKEEG